MGDISIKGRSPLLKGGRVGLKKGGGSAVWLRGRSGQTIKAPRGKAGWKQMQDYEAKIPKASGKQTSFWTWGDKFLRAGKSEKKDILTQLGKGSKYSKKQRKKAQVEDAMREKQSPWAGTSGAKVPHKKGGKVQ
jgi:hypothetical protein|tara:strand:- start:135 stop:536 length:402 start_codon:yes stop_codon:yes gene_type:complete